MRQKVMRELTKKPSQNYSETLFKSEPSELFQLAKKYSDEVGKTAISLGADEARMMAVLIKSHACKKFVEIGTLTGYSALWTLEGLAECGELWTLEKDPAHGERAAKVFTEFNKTLTTKKVHLVMGDARVELENIAKNGPFDGIFIDGNKAAYGDYLAWAEKNVRKGGIILADNVYLGGAVWGDSSWGNLSEKQVQVMQKFNQRLADTDKYFSTLIDTAEGLFMALKKF